MRADSAVFLELNPVGATRNLRQYASLILIMLTFIIGSFTKPYEGGATQITPPDPSQSNKMAQLRRFGDLQYSDMFKNSDAELNQDNIDALQFILSNHDVNAEISVFAGLADSNVMNQSVTDEQMALAIARAMSMYRYFSEHGVPAEAIRVHAVATLSDAQVKVKFVDVKGQL